MEPEDEEDDVCDCDFCLGWVGELEAETISIMPNVFEDEDE